VTNSRLFLDALNTARFARERLGFEPDAMQAELLEKSPSRVLLNCSRQWGKSTVAAAKAVHRAYSHAGSLTLVVTPCARQSAEFLRKTKAFVSKLGIRPRSDGDNKISLLLPNGSRIVGLPGDEATVRGFSSVSLLVIDEAARVSDDLYKAVRPMLALSGGDLWLMSTPFGKRGFFWEEWRRGHNWMRVTAPATRCPRIPQAFLQEEKAALGERWFRQEYLCEFVDTEDSVFRDEVITEAIDHELEPLFGK
jgi:hypothetical protein